MIAALLACEPPPHHGEVVARVPVSDPAEVEALEALGDVWTERVEDHVDLRLPARDLPRLPPGSEVVVRDVGDLVDRSFGGAGPGFFEDWRTLDEVDDFLDELAARGPDAHVEELGDSVEGRPIRALVVDPPGPADRVTLLVTATQHAREWVAAASALWVAEKLVDEDGVDPDVTALLDRYRVAVVPIVNPDGYRYTWTTDRVWRKNRRDNGDGTHGIDLNRNWDAAFGGPGSAAATTSGNYRGPYAFSEPETAVIRDWVDARPEVAVHVDVHCTGQIALTSWGFTDVPAPDADELEGRASDAEHAMEAVHGLAYRSGPTYTALYPASGIAIDWTYGVHGAAPFLFELRDHGEYGFLLPPDQIVPTAEEAWAGLLAVTAGPVVRLSLELPAPLSGGAPGALDTARSPAGTPIGLWWSATGTGSTPLQGGGTIGLDHAALLALATTAADGTAELGFDVPASWSGHNVWFQAWDGSTLSVPREVTVY